MVGVINCFEYKITQGQLFLSYVYFSYLQASFLIPIHDIFMKYEVLEKTSAMCQFNAKNIFISQMKRIQDICL